MEIRFRDKKIRELCEKRAVANKKLGTDCARKLFTRMSELESACRVTELAAGRPHPLKGDRRGQFSLDLSGGWRLVFAPEQHPAPTNVDGSTDWSQVTIVCIEFIGDYHD